MAYVVARPGRPFEVRESVHTPRGPRARSLASFRVLTGDVLARASERAVRPFSDSDVIASARRVGAPLDVGWDTKRFVDASRRMSSALDRSSSQTRTDPGASLLGLLNFADMVSSSVGPRPWEPLDYPKLARLARRRARRKAV